MLLKTPRTQRQKEVFDYLVSFLQRRGYIPTYAQIAKHIGVKSRATVAKHMKALAKLDLIQINEEPFGIVINQQAVQQSDLFWEVPVAGFIAAGQPIELVANGDTISVPAFMLGHNPERVFAAHVQGDSMIDEHICDGDIALIEKRATANNGEIVMVLVNESDATLKRIYQRGSEIELRPSNPQHESIRVHAGNVRVQGIFRGLLRQTRQKS
jgi:repressor LexA